MQELQREGVSYTVDTMRNYAARFPGAALFCLIGADNARLLTEWQSAVELSQMADFVVIPRPGEPEVPIPAPFHGTHLHGWPLAVSSSEIRARIKAGKAIDHLVPALVVEAIRNNRLYL